jgi:hypothetical protein
MLRQTQMAPLAVLGNTARPLGGLSGVRTGTPTTTVTATGTTWTCKPHAGILDVESAAEAGPYGYAVDANVTGAVTAANASNPRVDLLYARLSDPAESDGSTTPQVEILYLAGTAGSGAAPATPARGSALAWINVPISGGGSPTVTWVAPGVTPGEVQFQTKALLDLWTTAAPGQRVTVINDSTVGKNLEYTQTGGVWSPLRVSGSYHPAAAATFYTITFPSAFSAAPLIFAQVKSGAANSIGATILITNITTTSFQIRLALTSGAPDADVQLHWLAVPSV